ncbi:unnamed protein product, partial [Amoebophrya sp. A25]|eukprot:GSA25T00011306001.1
MEEDVGMARLLGPCFCPFEGITEEPGSDSVVVPSAVPDSMIGSDDALLTAVPEEFNNPGRIKEIVEPCVRCKVKDVDIIAINSGVVPVPSARSSSLGSSTSSASTPLTPPRRSSPPSSWVGWRVHEPDKANTELTESPTMSERSGSDSTSTEPPDLLLMKEKQVSTPPLEAQKEPVVPDLSHDEAPAGFLGAPSISVDAGDSLPMTDSTGCPSPSLSQDLLFSFQDSAFGGRSSRLGTPTNDALQQAKAASKTTTPGAGGVGTYSYSPLDRTIGTMPSTSEDLIPFGSSSVVTTTLPLFPLLNPESLRWTERVQENSGTEDVPITGFPQSPIPLLRPRPKSVSPVPGLPDQILREDHLVEDELDEERTPGNTAEVFGRLLSPRPSRHPSDASTMGACMRRVSQVAVTVESSMSFDTSCSCEDYDLAGDVDTETHQENHRADSRQCSQRATTASWCSFRDSNALAEHVCGCAPDIEARDQSGVVPIFVDITDFLHKEDDLDGSPRGRVAQAISQGKTGARTTSRASPERSGESMPTKRSRVLVPRGRDSQMQGKSCACGSGGTVQLSEQESRVSHCLFIKDIEVQHIMGYVGPPGSGASSSAGGPSQRRSRVNAFCE